MNNLSDSKSRRLIYRFLKMIYISIYVFLFVFTFLLFLSYAHSYFDVRDFSSEAIIKYHFGSENKAWVNCSPRVLSSSSILFIILSLQSLAFSYFILRWDKTFGFTSLIFKALALFVVFLPILANFSEGFGD